MQASEPAKSLLLTKSGLIQSAICLLMVLLYGAILGVPLGNMHCAYPNMRLTLNSMLEHLMRWQFDVDAGDVSLEGYLRNGHMYAYWGIWCALIRMPLWILHRLDWDVSDWSGLIAVCLAGMAKLRTLFLLLNRFRCTAKTQVLAAWLMLVGIVLGSSQISYLKISIYQEVIFWAYAFSAWFVYFAIRGIVQGYSARTLCAMAALTGLTVMTRVSTGIGLTVSLGLLCLMMIWRDVRGEKAPEKNTLSAFWLVKYGLPVLILALLFSVTGLVNYYRWGSPTTFVNFHLSIGFALHPERMQPMLNYGTFSLQRLPLGLIYYFFPIWPLQDASGHFFFEAAQVRLFDVLELPPSSFLLTDLFPLCLVALFFFSLFRGSQNRLAKTRQWLPIAIGLLIPAVMVLCLCYLAHRYRMEFYPLFDFLAFLGFAAILSDPEISARFEQHRKKWIAALVGSVFCSFVAQALNLMSDYGLWMGWVRDAHGITHFYYNLVIDAMRQNHILL